MTEQGYDLIKRFEGFRSEWYQDVAGVWTIGYGTTTRLPGFTRSSVEEPIDELTADTWLRYAVQHIFEPGIKEILAEPLVNEEQLTALVSLAYNVGIPALKGSDLMRHIKAGRMNRAVAEFDRWVYAYDKELGRKRVDKGLARRRAIERELFEEGTVNEQHIEDLQPVPIRDVEPLPPEGLTPITEIE